MSAEILTANELLSGGVVYLASDGEWIEDINQARLFGADETEARDAAIEAAKKTGRLVGVETEAVETVDGKIVANRLRERIRALGPTVPVQPRQPLEEGDHVSI